MIKIEKAVVELNALDGTRFYVATQTTLYWYIRYKRRVEEAR